MSAAVLEAPPVAVAPADSLPPASEPVRVLDPLLELPEFRARVWRMPVDVYERLVELGGVFPRRGELLEGIVVEKPVMSPLHRRLTRRILLPFMSAAPDGHTVFSEAPLRLAHSEPEPDVMVVRGAEAEFDWVHPGAAELVVEVAVSSLAADRRMAPIYARGSVPEYWIVVAAEEAVEVYRRPEDGVYQEVRRVGRGETLVCERLPEMRVALDELFG